MIPVLIDSDGRMTFKADPEDRHAASRAVERWVRERNMSIGPTCTAGRRAVFFDGMPVTKWHNLSPADVAEADAVVIGRAGGDLHLIFRERQACGLGICCLHGGHAGPCAL